MAKTITLNASPAWPGVKNDFILSYEGHAIGRIRQAETAWEWHIIVPMAMPAWADGRADNFEDCKRAFAGAWGRFLKETDPARLKRAWDLARAAEARQRPTETVNKDDAPSSVTSSN